MSTLMQPQILWVISIIASVFQVALIISAFINQGITPESGFKTWTRKTSVRLTISAFVGFGWGGVLAFRQNLPPDAAFVIAMVSAVAFTVLMTVLLRFLIEQ